MTVSMISQKIAVRLETAETCNVNQTYSMQHKTDSSIHNTTVCQGQKNS